MTGDQQAEGVFPCAAPPKIIRLAENVTLPGVLHQAVRPGFRCDRPGLRGSGSLRYPVSAETLATAPQMLAVIALAFAEERCRDELPYLRRPELKVADFSILYDRRRMGRKRSAAAVSCSDW
jgi:hypothetical protein